VSIAPLGSRLQIAFWWFAWGVLSVPWTLAFRWVPGDALSTPRDGPFLLVANHTSACDPIWIAFWLFRRSSFMASSALFRIPFLGHVLPLCGCFPKEKFVKDRDSMRTLAERHSAGDVIVLFPEGTRTFDGRTRPVLSGIGRLVKRLNARVVCARILNGHLYQPRWARFPRWIPIRVEYDAVRSWPEDATVEQINEDISDAIRVDLEDPPTGFMSLGFRLAEGLPDYIWACPSCFEQEGLEARGKRVRCRSCTAEWTLDTRNRMVNTRQGAMGQPHAPHEVAGDLWVHEAFDRLDAHFADTALSGTGSLIRLQGRSRETLDSGSAILDGEALTVGDTVLALSELRAVSVEVQNRLTFRRGDELLELVPEGQSPLKWGHFLARRLSGLSSPR